MNLKKTISTIILLFIISGCSLLNKGGPTATISSTQIHTGTQGLETNFLKNSPPDAVFEDEEFPVYVQVANNGAADIQNGYIAIGFQQDYFQSSLKNYNFNIRGKSLGNPAGEQQFFRFLISAKEIIGDTRTIPITVSSCYSYNTIATVSVCIDTDVYNVKAVQKACSIQDINLKGGQGGPITVTKIEPKMVTNEGNDVVIPQFTIDVENVEKGTVLKTSNVRDLCSASVLTKDTLNTVEISVSLAEQKLTCNKDVLKLENNKDSIVCQLESGIDKTQPAYSTLLQIKLDYGYSDSITKSTTINKKA